MTKSFGEKLTIVLEKHPWYNDVWTWYNEEMVTSKEIHDGVDYLYDQ